MVDRTLVIGFAGVAGSGKTTAAMHLLNIHGYVHTRFADPIKAMLRVLGLGSAELDGMLKEKPMALLGGKTPRYAMQTLGTEWGRDLISRTIWEDLWVERASDCIDLGGRVVVDDVRFANEAEAVRKLGGMVIRITGRGGIAGGHISEQMDFPTDATIENSGDLGAFLDQVSALTQISLA
ncbi:deoxynucleotide monophosphate kinase family protein [Kaistia sp. MMO-174]|uniref:deoxynucleotide monophosphate kinase family protein n=1 Tax=Kaistia sp. MMO-174 TaxID=3081256 RepID=UPI0030186036